MNTAPQSSSRPWLGPVVGIIVASAFLFFWAQLVRSAGTQEPFSFALIHGFNLDPYPFGIAILEALSPVALLFIFSRTPIFRRAIRSELSPVDRGKLTAGLIFILLLSLVARYTVTSVIEAHVLTGFFLVFVAGLMGGWQAGLSAGVILMFANGLLEYAPWSPDNSDGFVLDSYVSWFIIHNMEAMAALWVGAVAGFLHALFPIRQRFSLPTVMGSGLAIETIFVCARVYSEADPSGIVYDSISVLTITLFSLVAFAMMLRTLQDEENRIQAEEAQLELAQMNLALTQTKLALAQAELRALHAQINPHFLFNSLNTIRYFIRTDPNLARDLLTRLSEIFQRALNSGEFVPLREEIAHTEAYLALEKARLDERLNIIWTNMAKELMDHPVPTLILQPVVENAVIHGISPKSEGGTIHIVINRVGNELLLQVDDDGVGINSQANATHQRAAQSRNENGVKVLDPSTSLIPSPQALEVGETELQSERPSIGLRNVTERMRVLYGDAYVPLVEPRAVNGTRVMIRIPLKS
ncbi:MAG: sensor histidine kinase [Caldilineaceae bacterium]